MINALIIFGAYLVATGIIFGLAWLIGRVIRVIRERKASNSGSKDEKLNADFKRLAKRTKIKRMALTAWISGAVVVILVGIGVAVNNKMMKDSFFKKSEQASEYFVIRSPNVSYNNLVVNNYGFFSSNLHADTYKNVDGYRVDWQDYDWGFGTIGTSGYGYQYQYVSPVRQGNAFYTQGSNQKVASFFLPKADYNSKGYYGLTPTHEAQKLSKLPNYLAEVAVTFDKAYTYDELQKMIPSNLMINWYWLGVNDSSNVDAAGSWSYYGLNSETDEKGNPTGKLTSDSYDNAFVPTVKRETGGSKYNSFDAGEDAKKMVEKFPNLKTAKFAGVILTGRTENLAGLDEENWTFATNVGVTTEILPYQNPVK
ncbi:MAG: anti-sigma factor [Streptococcaceae bacterium]|jgi:hypothetical protein|nr:anti-sigma factor [Streptococcaceae bacterium]